MAVHDTVENERTWMTEVTLRSLSNTVDWGKHRLIVSDNGSYQRTIDLLRNPMWEGLDMEVIYNRENLGTAKAINNAWQHRMSGEHCVKMDNDVHIHQTGWADWMEDVFERDPTIGICGLKRKDLAESPFSEGSMKSTIRMLPHEKGQRWLIVEEVNGVIGTCQGYSSALLDKIGYLVQPGVYGYDDALASLRARIAGFKRVFLHGFEIDHVDPGNTDYTQWKIDEAARYQADFNTLALLYESGAKEVYHAGS